MSIAIGGSVLFKVNSGLDIKTCRNKNPLQIGEGAMLNKLYQLILFRIACTMRSAFIFGSRAS